MGLRRYDTILAKLLAHEHAALLQGDYAALERLAPQKQQCLDAIRANPPAPEDLVRLHHQSKRNQSLLDAACDGLAHARATIVALGTRPGAATYGPDGQRQNLQAQTRILSRKF